MNTPSRVEIIINEIQKLNYTFTNHYSGDKFDEVSRIRAVFFNKKNSKSTAENL